MPGDGPVPLVVEPCGAAALRDPPDRGRAAQLGQLLVRHPGRADVRIGEVEASRDVRQVIGWMDERKDAGAVVGPQNGHDVQSHRYVPASSFSRLARCIT